MPPTEAKGNTLACSGATAATNPLCTEQFKNADLAALKVVPEAGYAFTGWTVNGAQITTASADTLFLTTMPTLAGLANILPPGTTEANVEEECKHQIDIAFTFDDGPHVSLTGRTMTIINTLLSRQQTLKKPVHVTFFVEHSRITSGLGKKILKEYMCQYHHEVGLHGAHETAHHRKHQDTEDLQTRLTTMKAVIASEEAGGITPAHVRPPGGWGGWTVGTIYAKDQVVQIYQNVSLVRYTGEGTDGVNSWGKLYPSRCDQDTSECWPTSEDRIDFINTIKTKIDNAKTAKTPPKLVILMHDLRLPDVKDIGNIIDEIETYAETQSVRINYKTLEELY